MQNDVRLRYHEVLDSSHHGRPVVVERVHTGNRGRPRIVIDEEFLRWASTHRSTTAISRFLDVSRTVVRNALLEYGIEEPQADPFAGSRQVTFHEQHPTDTLAASQTDSDMDDLLDPEASIFDLTQATHLQNHPVNPQIISYTAPVSNITDLELDNLLLELRSSFRRAGISILDGMLRGIGYRVPRERIRMSLMRIDPVQRVFQRIRIRRREYQVPGPNSLWHHDGQHGVFILIAILK
jgi:hypothetical protein